MNIHETLEYASDTAPAYAARQENTNLIRACLELGKARLSATVTGTAAAGYVLASEGSIDVPRLLVTLAGTFLCATGSGALNQWQERRLDALMERTRKRPLPTGTLSSSSALWAGSSALITGLILLSCLHWLPALLGGLAAFFYIVVYAPLKTRSPSCTLIGAIVGALPPAMGWTAAAERLDTGAWLFAAILFVWQIPHFMALAWRYRDDYARAGFQMLPNVEPSGHSTGNMAIGGSLLLLALGPFATFVGLAGMTYAIGSVILGLMLLVASVVFRRQRSNRTAMTLFKGSMAYLFLLLSLMLIDRTHPHAQPVAFGSQPRSITSLTRP